LENLNLGKVIDRLSGKIKREKTTSEEEGRPVEETTPNTAAETSRALVIPAKVYLKALTLRSLEEIDNVKNEVKSGNILVIRVDPLVEKNVDDVKRAIGELSEFAAQIGGDIARLGEERIVVTPSFVKIWRGRTPESEGEISTEA